MRPTRTHLALLLLGITFLGAWWTVTAQEGLRPPAPVRPPSLSTPSLRIDDNPAKPAPPITYENAPSVPMTPLIVDATMPTTPEAPEAPKVGDPPPPAVPKVSDTTPPLPKISESTLPVLPLPESSPSAPPLTLPLPASERRPAPTTSEPSPPPLPLPPTAPHASATTTAAKPAPSEVVEVIVIPPEEIHKYQTKSKSPAQGKPTAKTALPIIRDEPAGKAAGSIGPRAPGEESMAPPVNPIDEKAKEPVEVPTFPPPPTLVPPLKSDDAPPAFPQTPKIADAPPALAPPPMLPGTPRLDAPTLTAPTAPPSPKASAQDDIPTSTPSVPLQRPNPPRVVPVLPTPTTQSPEQGTYIGPAATPAAPLVSDAPVRPPVQLTQRVTPQGEPLLEMNVKTQLFRNGPTQAGTQPSLVPDSRGAAAPIRAPEPRIPANSSTTPLVTVLKKGPASQTTGGVVQYHIHVKNIGHYTAEQVRVVDEIPSSIRLDYSDPVPTKLEGGKASWDIPTLQPGEERTLRIDLKPLRPGAVVSTASVHVSARYPFKLNVNGEPLEEQRFPPEPTPVEDRKPEIALPPSKNAAPEIKGGLKVRAPDTSNVGSQVVFEVFVTNSGEQALSGLKLWVKLPEGLFHKAGKDIIADLPSIPAGKTEKFEVPVTATKLGQYFMQFRVTGATGELWNASQGIMLIGSTPTNMPLPLPPPQRRGGLNLRVTPAAALALKREAEIRIDVTNDHTETVKQTQLLHVVPEGVDVVAVGELGMYQPTSRTASWIVPTLAPGESKTVTLRVMPRTPGQLPLEVIAKTTELGEVKAEQTVAIEGLTSVSMRLAGRDSNLALGKDTIYEIRVLNEGSGAATNIRVQVALPPGMQPHKHAQAPTRYIIEGSTITFEPLPSLAPGTQMVYHIGGRAVAVGDHRIRASVTCDQQPTPLIREVQTLAFQSQ